MKRDYERLYKNSLKKRKKLENKYHEALEKIFEIKCDYINLKEKFNTEVTKKVNEYVNNYEGQLQNEVYKWREYYIQINTTLKEKEIEIERLRNGYNDKE